MSKYLNIFKNVLDWAIKNQSNDGSWSTFEHIYPNNPYSSMAQGEGISLLIRGYLEFNDDKYLETATKALDFMIKPIESGGTTKYNNDDIYFCEVTNQPVILNGWIFSIFGIIDYLLVYKHEKKINDIYKKTINSLKNSLPKYDNNYWSKYDISNRIASPFYHNLHIALLKVLGDITGIKEFLDYSFKFEGYKNKNINKIKAFAIKSLQKIKE